MAGVEIKLNAPAPLGGTCYILLRGLFSDEFKPEVRTVTGYLLQASKPHEARLVDPKGHRISYYKLDDIFPTEAAALAAIPEYEKRFIKHDGGGGKK